MAQMGKIISWYKSKAVWMKLILLFLFNLIFLGLLISTAIICEEIFGMGMLFGMIILPMTLLFALPVINIIWLFYIIKEASYNQPIWKKCCAILVADLCLIGFCFLKIPNPYYETITETILSILLVVNIFLFLQLITKPEIRKPLTTFFTSPLVCIYFFTFIFNPLHDHIIWITSYF